MTFLPNDEDDAGHPYVAFTLRLTIPGLLALATTTALLYFMQFLIASSRVELDESSNLHLVDFVRVDQNQELQVKERKVKKPPEPEELPPPELNPVFNIAVNDAQWGVSDVQLEDSGLSRAFNFVSDGNYLPIVKVQPVYPRSALIKGIEGWVVVGFDVDEYGRVVDPVVLDNCAHAVSPANLDKECWDSPNSLFDKSALRAASKFKYKPKVVNGVAVVAHNVRNKITFELEKE